MTADVVPLHPEKPHLTPATSTCRECDGTGSLSRQDLTNVNGRTFWDSPRTVPCPFCTPTDLETA